MRAMLAGVPGRTVAIAFLLAAFLVYGTSTNAAASMENAACALSDWEAALAHFEAGGNQYDGACVSTSGGGEPGDEEPQRLLIEYAREQVEANRLAVQEAHSALTSDVWGKASSGVAGPAMVVFTLLFTTMATGGLLGSGTAAWSLSNGWDRPRWISTLVRTAVIVILVVFLLLLLIYLTNFGLRLSALGFPLNLGVPGLSFVTPIPGVLFYGALGMGVALILKQELLALGIGTVVVLADWTAGNLLTRPEVLPSLLHKAALGEPGSTTTPWVAASILLALAVILAAICRWLFIHKLDVPDRPL